MVTFNKDQASMPRPFGRRLREGSPDLRDLKAEIHGVLGDLSPLMADLRRINACLTEMRADLLTINRMLIALIVVTAVGIGVMTWQASRIDASIKSLDASLDKLESSIEARFDKVDARFDRQEAQFDRLDAMLAKIIEQTGPAHADALPAPK